MAPEINKWTRIALPSLFGGLFFAGAAAVNQGVFLRHDDISLPTLLLPFIIGLSVIGVFSWLLFNNREQRGKQLAAEEELLQSEARYRDIIEGTTDLVTVVDGKGRFLFVNHMAEKVYGYSAEDCIGKLAFDFIHPDDRDETMAAFGQWLEKKEPTVTFENRQMHRDGSFRHMQWIIQYHRGHKGDAAKFMSTARDITEQKNLEAQLRQSQKLEVVGQLTGGVAHDFNNLLTVMMGNAEMLEDKVKGDVEAAGELKAISIAVERAAALTERLLAFSRQQTLTPERANIARLIGGLEDMLRRSLGELIELEIHKEDDLWPAYIDTHQFENVLINLAVNARDAMPDGGVLVFETGNVTLDAVATVDHEDLSPGDYVSIVVRDNGCGMSADVRERVFEPFFTTKGVGEGSGLGLSMVFGFIKQSHGHLELISEEGRGTTITLYLPRASED